MDTGVSYLKHCKMSVALPRGVNGGRAARAAFQAWSGMFDVVAGCGVVAHPLVFDHSELKQEQQQYIGVLIRALSELGDEEVPTWSNMVLLACAAEGDMVQPVMLVLKAWMDSFGEFLHGSFDFERVWRLGLST